jgi:hypothetical protein
MRRRWRIVLATLSVEAIAAVAVLVSGALSVVVVAAIYWIDLAFVIARSVTRQLLGGETTVVELPRALPQFRLLEQKRGTLSLSEHLPPVHVRSLPAVLFSLSILAASALSTAVVLAVSVPEQFWSAPTTPLLLGGGVIAAATKSWLLYTARSGVADTSGAGFVGGKRQLVVLLYAPVMYLAADGTTTALAEPEVESTVLFVVAVVIALRVAYGIRASRPSARSRDSVGGGESGGVDDRPVSTPDGQPLETAEPVARSVPAAAVVNALTTGGVVDGRFSGAGLQLRVIGSLFVVVPGTLAAVDGSSVFRLFIAGVVFSGVVFWLLSSVHMELAFGAVEYRFYDSAVVAYDRRLGEPQWSIPYDSVESTSVDRGLFGSPLRLDAGTVSMDVTDGTAPVPDTRGRASILFVPDPERISDRVSSGRSDPP